MSARARFLVLRLWVLKMSLGLDFEARGRPVEVVVEAGWERRDVKVLEKMEVDGGVVLVGRERVGFRGAGREEDMIDVWGMQRE